MHSPQSSMHILFAVYRQSAHPSKVLQTRHIFPSYTHPFNYAKINIYIYMGSFAICLSNLDIDLLTIDAVNMLANCGINYCCVHSPSNGQNSLNHRVPHSWGSTLNQPSILQGNMLLFHSTFSDIVLTKVYSFTNICSGVLLPGKIYWSHWQDSKKYILVPSPDSSHNH